MKTKVYLPLLTFILFLLPISSCQKPLHDSEIIYIGSWGSDNYSLEIWKDGRGLYEKRNQGPVECTVKIEDGKIKFRNGTFKTFDIVEDPYVDADGNTVMNLDGEIFLKH